MNTSELTLTAAVLSMIVLEGIKQFYKRVIKKNVNYVFPDWIYWLGLPLLNAVAPFGLVAIGIPSTDPVLTMTAVGVVQYLFRVCLAAVGSSISYTAGLKPLKDYHSYSVSANVNRG